MSLSDFSSKSSIAIEELCVEEKTGDDYTDKSPTRVNADPSSPDRCLRDKVLKEVGLTSTAFIGPAFFPETSTAKCDIDDTLSKFYEELEKIDPPDLNQTESNPEKDDGPPQPPELPASKETRDEPEGKLHITKTSPETSSYLNKRGHTNFSWPHWYGNEPYQLKQQRPTSNQHSYLPFSHRPPFHRFIQPSLPHLPHLSVCPHPQNLPPYIDNAFTDSRMTNQNYNKFNLPALPPPHTCLHPSQGLYGNPPKHLSWKDTDSDNRTAGWSGNGRETWSWHDENYDRHQRLPQRPDRLHDNTHAFQSSLVLILMRGLPGSGKSTLARYSSVRSKSGNRFLYVQLLFNLNCICYNSLRELLSTGPSGVILSTDDYFAQKNGYRYDVGLLGAAHEWNQSRGKD